MKPQREQVRDNPKIPVGNHKVIYIAGPYRSKTEEGKRENIWHAVRVSCRLSELGWYPICPHANTANFEWYTKLPEEHWIEMGLELLRRSDAIFMLKGFRSSIGSMAELELAIEKGLDVFYES